VIVDFEQANLEKVIGMIRDKGVDLAPKSLNSVWFDSDNYNIVYDESILDTYLLQTEASSEQIFIDSTQSRAEDVQVTNLLTLKEKCLMIMQELAMNFSVEKMGTEVFDFLKIITMDTTTFISGMLTYPEMKRLRYRYCGLTAHYQNDMKKMVLSFFILIKIFLPEVLGYPLYFHKHYSIESRKRL
jgi:hypothetical protein